MPLIKQRGLKGLNFSILCDVFLLFPLLLLLHLAVEGQTIEIVPGVFSEDDLVLKPIPGSTDYSISKSPERKFDSYSDISKSAHDTIHRILRDEDSVVRIDDHRVTFRWKKSADPPMHRKVSKREIEMLLPMNNSSSENSTKSLDLVNSNLTKFVIDSDLELQIKQSDDRGVITRLNLTNNLISEFSTKDLIPSLASVQILDLSYNNLSKFVIDSRSELQQVDLSGNYLSSFLVAFNHTKLKTLSIQNNNLSWDSISWKRNQFNLTPAVELETLDLSCNEVSHVTSNLVGSGRALKRLNLSKNRLRRIQKDMFYNLINIDTLILSHNQIESIDAETFMILPNLQFLDLSYNNITTESIRALQGIPDLVGLSIAYNPNLADALQEFVASWSLKELDASGTGLCRIPSALAQSVRTLVLVDNWFEIIRCGDLDSYPLLQYLDLSHSHITEIEDDALGRLEMLQTLFLDHNNLKRIPVSLPTNLENLFLHNNEITDIQPQSLQQLSNLRTLDLSRNKLSYIPSLPLPKLLVLNLQFSELKGLSQSVVKTSPKLRDLLLDGNPIKCTELMGIAEWASPCQNRESGAVGQSIGFDVKLQQEQQEYQEQHEERPYQEQGIKKSFIEMHNYMSGFPNTWHQCSGNYEKPNPSDNIRPLCASVTKNVLLLSNKLETQFNKTTTIARQTKLRKTIATNRISVLNQSNEDIENSIHVNAPAIEFSNGISDSSTQHENGNNPKSKEHSIGVTGHILGQITSSLANNQSIEARKLPNDTTIRIHDGVINGYDDNSRISSINGNNNLQENKLDGKELKDDAKAATFLFTPSSNSTTTTTTTTSSMLTPKPQSQSQRNADVSNAMFTKLSRKSMQRKQQNTSNQYNEEEIGRKRIKANRETATTMPRLVISTASPTPQIAIESKSLLNTRKPDDQQISVMSSADKLVLTSTVPSLLPSVTPISLATTRVLLPSTTKSIRISDSVSDVMKTIRQAKMMMLAIQPSAEDVFQETTRKVSRTTSSSEQQRQDIANDKAIYTISAMDSVNITSANTFTSYPIPSTAASTKTTLNLPRIASKMLSSKVNKADKVADHQQISPSAINENGIIKRNQSSSAYHSPHRVVPAGHEGMGAILTRKPNDTEQLIHRPQSSVVEAINNSDQRHNQNINQQNQQTKAAEAAAGIPTLSILLSSTTPTLGRLGNKKTPKSQDKVKDDKHLRFVGAKNLNLTVLTYNRKGHTHRTINKDIARQPYHPPTTISPSQQLFSELGLNRVPPIDFQSTSQAPSSSLAPIDGVSHVKVNTKRILSESNSHHNTNHKQGRQDDADLHPQLNALHALASLNVNASASNASSNTGLPPERWLDIRTATGHPGLFIVIGLTIGLIFTLGLIHIYKCRHPAARGRASHLHPLHGHIRSPHCCNNNGTAENGNNSSLHEYSPGHFCSYSHNTTEDDAGYYIEPDQNRIRTSARRDFLPMELLRPAATSGNYGEGGRGYHHPDSHVHSIW